MNDEQVLRDPTDVDLNDPLFEAIWQAIKPWDLSRDGPPRLYAGASGTDVMTILSAVRAALSAPASSGASEPEYGYTEAFYEISALLGIGAQDATPETVFKTQVLPKLRALIAERDRFATPPAEAVRQPLMDSKQYSDGTTATGPAPLPDFSPKQQILLADLGAIEAMLGGRNGPTIRIRAAIEAGITGAQE